ncbi:MAG: hypothetical protein GEU97_01745 [Actinophytocola sp.]|nr:hypothetical protein [Actinophytocola sp.]
MAFDAGDVARALEQLDEARESVVTSVRVPQGLRHAATVLQDAGLVSSWNELLVQGARDRIEAIAHRAGLDAHYADHPEARPAVGEVALALARMDASELANRPDVIEQAATELTRIRPDATADDVLTYATALLAHQPAA